MFNNPDNLTADQMLYNAMTGVTDHPVYLPFLAPERIRNVLYYTLYRIVWDRDDVPSLMRDHAFFHADVPEKLLNP